MKKGKRTSQNVKVISQQALNIMYKLIEVKALEKYKIRVKYKDGSEGKVDLSDVAGQGIFKFWDIENNFEKIYINSETDGIAWSDELEICPDTIYYEINNINPKRELSKDTV